MADSGPKRPQRWPFWLLGAWFVLSVVYLKVYLHARVEFRAAEQQAKAGKLQVAIRHYGQTLRWYTPGSRYVSVAVLRLKTIGEHAFRRGDWEQAIIAFQHLRNGLSSIRGIYQPHKRALQDCQERLAVVLSHLPGHTKAKTASRVERQSLILSLLQEDHRPAAWLSLLMLCGYVLWLWLAARLCWLWSTLGWGGRAGHGVGAVACFVFWILCLGWA